MAEKAPKQPQEGADFRKSLAMKIRALEGVRDELRHAVTIHNQAVLAVKNFHELYLAAKAVREEGGTQFDGEDDLLRAMLLFACSGLDAAIKQLIDDSLPSIINNHVGAHQEFAKFVERKFKRSASDDTERPNSVTYFDYKLLSEILVSDSPKSRLISALIYHLCGDSLQSRDQILKVAAHFAITRDEIMRSPDITKDAFVARNQIAHEMDIDLESGNQRRQRDYKTMAKWSENIVAISAQFIDIAAQRLPPVAA